MYHSIQLTTTVPPVRNSPNRSPLRRGFLLIPLTLALAWFALSQTTQAVSPPPDGGYPEGNTAEGDDALLNLTTGSGNTAIGFQALLRNTTGTDNTATGRGALFSNTTGYDNTAHGGSALQSNTSGFFNTATGNFALFSNTTGHGNTANGTEALFHNSTGYDNTATGVGALFSNIRGHDNTANGVSALQNNTNGFFNTATGFLALASNTTGFQNTANGVGALDANTTGSDNMANGFDVLNNNATGSSNTATGNFALFSNTTGSNNAANGFGALTSNTIGSNNTADGVNALLNLSTGSNNTALGFNAGTALLNGNNNIEIGNAGAASDSNTIRIGTTGTQTKTFVAGISGVTVAGGVGVIVDSSGHLGTVVSSERFKDEIKPMDKASETILSLKPVTFCYKHELDPDGIPQFGLVAEQVEKVNPDLVARDDHGKPYTVRYDAVNAMLLNEFLKEHRKVERIEATVVQQQKDFIARLEEQAAQIQKVSAQVELSKPAPRTVLNNQ